MAVLLLMLLPSPSDCCWLQTDREPAPPRRLTPRHGGAASCSGGDFYTGPRRTTIIIHGPSYELKCPPNLIKLFFFLLLCPLLTPHHWYLILIFYSCHRQLPNCRVCCHSSRRRPTFAAADAHHVSARKTTNQLACQSRLARYLPFIAARWVPYCYY